MTRIKRVAYHTHWLVAALALALVCVPASYADDKSDLIRRIEDKLADAASALERLPDDANDGALDRARALVAEARRHADDLGRIAGDDSEARRIAEESRRREVYCLADSELSLGLTKAVVRRCDLLVTTDSGPRHFAAAFGRPVVTLFGPTHIAWTETFHAAATHLQKEVPCGPCQKRVCPLDHKCMTSLMPAEVFEATDRLLAGHREARHVG